MKYHENRLYGADINSRVNPLTVTLTLSLASWVMCSAHRPTFCTRRNIWVKLHENRLKGSGDMERARNSRESHLTLTCAS